MLKGLHRRRRSERERLDRPRCRLIVADYFDMLRMELAGEPYIKARNAPASQAV
jgi:hypothetical protein